MTREKIECPEWLKDPKRYDVAKDFTMQDWYEQVVRRHWLNYKLDNNKLEYPLSEYLSENIIFSSAASLNASIRLMELKPSLFQDSDFKDLGLIYDSVWSQSIADVKLRNDINQMVQKKHAYISDDFPNKICEQLAGHDGDFKGVVSVNIDLFEDDEKIKKEFNKWLKSTKRFYRYDQHSKFKFDNWAKYRSLAYWDLMLWVNENDYTYGKPDSKIPKATIQRWILGDKIGTDHYGIYSLIDASERDYLAMSKKQMLTALERRFPSANLTNSKSAVKITRKLQPEKQNKMDISEYLKSKGYKAKQ